MGFQEDFAELRQRNSELKTLRGISSVLSYDQSCFMPAGAAAGRSRQSAYLGALVHEKQTDPAFGDLLARLEQDTPEGEEFDVSRREVQLSKRRFEKATKLPKEHTVRMIEATHKAIQSWVRARSESNFSLFADDLKQLLDLTQDQISYFEPYEHPYDVLLDRYESGTKTWQINSVFNAIKPLQIDLIQRIVEADPVDDSFLKQPFDVAVQRQVGEEISRQLGFDMHGGRIDTAAHPFTTTLGSGDVRYTNRFIEDAGMASFFAAMHESGHALYDQGENEAYADMLVAQPVSSMLQESQSRFWENMVGRSRPFWQYWMPKMREYYPSQLGAVGLEHMYRAVNRVRPTPIRVQADEATYNLHIFLRFELELALIEGKLSVEHLPQAWNDLMKAYLGITPENYAAGVLQDMHWGYGMFGYFATYTLGNLAAAQIWHRMSQDLPELNSNIAVGDFKPLLHWQRENIHHYGSLYEPMQLLENATGEPLNPQYYLDYLTQKYSEIYTP